MKQFHSLKVVFISLILFTGVMVLSAFIRNRMPQKHAAQDAIVTAALTGSPEELPLYGFNGNNVRGPSFSNATYRDSIAATELQVIRYPGGSQSEWWDWQKGWFADENTTGTSFKLPANYKTISPVPYGLNDLKLLTEQTHCEVIFTLNMVTRGIDDQLAMLKQAQSIGIPVRWVELGNELNLPRSPGRQKFPSPKQYGQTCREWIGIIKSFFPGVKIAVVGGNQNYDAELKSWNDDVFAMAPDADALVAHLYPIPEKVVDDSGINFENLYNTFKDRFDVQGFNEITNKAIWVTEYNIQWAYYPAGMQPDEKKQIQANSSSWGQALATLLMTSEATSLSPDVQMVINHNISGIPIWAAIETQNKTFRQLPNGIGMSAWLRACNNMKYMQEMSFTNGNKKQLAYYELFGWKFSNGAHQTILIVNLSANATSINLAPVTSGSMKYLTLSSDKNKQVSSSADIVKTSGIEKHGIVNLPPYSVTTFTN